MTSFLVYFGTACVLQGWYQLKITISEGEESEYPVNYIMNN
jgi:hypothetical protein